MFKKRPILFNYFLFALLSFVLIGTLHAETITLYSGRSKSLVDPIIQQFEKETGIEVKVSYANTTQLAAKLLTEGRKSPASLFWAQDAGALGAVSAEKLFEKLPKSILNKVPKTFRHDDGYWIATSGRARVLAYSPERVKMEALPESVFDLTQPKWRGKVGWAPLNASFQAFVTAMRAQVGEERAEKWLRDMKANGAKAYPKNTPIIEALAAGEIDLGLPNHYYLFRFKKRDSKYPVEQTFFKAKDVGNIVNVAGIGLLKSSDNKKTALKLVEFLLSTKAQQYFVSEVFEYPVTEGVIPNANLLPLEELLKIVPKFDLNEMDDLEGTIKLLRRAGIM
ncbi:iron ABC transporter substrate-binding protein [Candidatus Poribacteria bacterium]|nr:MAG: iron ABC transporter substrate-binding protein [Candidatus Poribacteria bacterium]